MLAFDLRLALRGELGPHRARVFRRIRAGIETSVASAGGRGKAAMRLRTKMIGLKGPVYKSWNTRFYPNRGKDPGAMVYTKAKEIFTTYTQGGTIRPRQKRFLVIPLLGPAGNGAPSMRKAGIRPGFPRQRKTLKDFIGQKGVRFIPLPGGRFLVVKETKSRTWLLFLLVKQTSHRPHALDFDRLMRRQFRRMVTDLKQVLNG